MSNCNRCGRELKDPWSAREGIGPVCKRKLEIERALEEADEELEIEDSEELDEEEVEDILDEMNRDYNRSIAQSLKRR